MNDTWDSVVELAIDEEWYRWSGFPRNILSPWKPAETDGPEFYTENAFPSLKPDIDILGIPRRSRKQRGWYQVTVPFIGQHGEQLGTRAHCRGLAKPSDIPPELFDDLLREAAGNWLSCDKHALATCALVCRYWATKCQEVIFFHLRLNSREDALQLLQFMKTSSTIASSVNSVHLPEDHAALGTPWLHLVSDIGDRAHRKHERFWVILQGPLPAGRRLRSIHHRLPRSLPGQFSRHLDKLSLTDIHFEKLVDFMNLIWEMPDLMDLSCARVTWTSLPAALSKRKPRNVSPYIKCIDMSQCGPHLVEASVWLAASVRPRDGAFFSADDFTRVLSFSRARENGAYTDAYLRVHEDSFYINLRITGQNVLFCDSQSHSQGWHIDTAIVDIRNYQGTGMAGKPELDWAKAVGRALSSFPELERIVIGLSSREDMIRFEEEVAQVHMSCLSGSGKVKYALWDPAELDQYGAKGTWLQASAYSDDTESSGYGTLELRKVYDEHSDEDERSHGDEGEHSDEDQ